MKKPTNEDLEQRIKELNSNVVENEQSNTSLSKNIINISEIDFLACLDVVGQAMNESKDVDHIIENAISAVFSFFECDRVWVFYPCDPDFPTFRVLSEKNNPEYPGAFHTGQEVPITPEAAQTIREALASGSPVVYDPVSGNKVNDVAAKFSVLSQMMIAVHPKSGKPWMFGMHQCSYARIWTKKEQMLFKEISNRVVEGLSNIILQKNLRKSEKKYRDLLENLPQRIFHKDKSSVYISCNKNFARDLKIEAEQIIGTTDYDYFPKDLADKYRRDDRRIIETGIVDTIEEEYIPIDGKKRIVQTVKTPIWNKQKEVVGLLGTFIDISERKKAEEELLKWGHIFQTAKWGIALGDLDNNTIELINPSYAEMHGYKVEEVADMSFFDMFIPSFRERLPEYLQQCQEVGHVTFEGDHICKNGFIFPAYHDLTTVKNEQGEALYHIVNIIDISERKQAEEEKKELEKLLQQTQKMESIGTLAGGIAHDFNNILSSIFGYAELVRDLLPPESDSYQMQNQVIKAARRAKGLVRQILLFSRQADQEKQLVQPHFIIKEALQLLRSSIPTTVDIKRNIPNDCGSIFADPTQVHQIIMNLCTNAYHAMRDKGGILQVSLSKVAISLNTLEMHPGSYIRLEVADTGHGMDKLTMERIFDPYFTTKPKGEGTGLGLSVVHGIITNIGGYVKVYSEPGKGARIHCYFPRIANEESTAKVRQKVPLRGGAERILFVDDEVAILQIMKKTLRDLGYKVTTFENGREALLAFQAHPDEFDLVVTDLTMPVMTGIELAKQVLTIRSEIPVILCTGFIDFDNKEEASALGVKEFLAKPILNSDLAAIVRKTLDA